MADSASVVRTLALCLALASSAPAAAEGPPSDLVERGRYLVQVMDCGGCHDSGAFTPVRDPAKRLAGSNVGFAGAWGVAYPPNLTPDPDTGLGRWSDAQVLTAVRTGRRPDGTMLAPVMPWESFSALTDEDGRALVAYLRSLAPVRNAAPRRVAAGELAPSPYFDIVQPEVTRR